MERSTYVASCPICGRVLFKGAPNSYLEGGCPKCGEYLKITFSQNGVSVTSGKNSAQPDGRKAGASM